VLISNPLTSPAHSLACELRDYPEWHRGRSRYAVWVLPVQCPILLAHIDRVQQQLSDVLHPPGRRQAHITLFVCGFISGNARHDDDFSKQHLQQQLKTMSRQSRQPLDLLIGQPDSFASAVFLPVYDPSGQLHNWRTRLGEQSTEVRQSPYHAHITLGLYRRSLPAEQLRERLLALHETQPRPLRIHQLQYATYNARQLSGPLRVRHSLRLRDQATD